MKKLIRLTVINAGGEFTAGVIDDQEIKDKLREKIDEGSVNTFMEFDDETYFEASNYTNILHQYGPNVPGSVVMTEESFDVDTEDVTLFSEMVKERITEDLTNGLHRKRQIGFGKLFKEIKAELALDDVEEGDLVQTGSEENSESTGREIVAFWNWDRKNYFVR